MERCFICAKHQDMSAVPGGGLISDEHCIVSHLPLTTPRGVEQAVYLGYRYPHTAREFWWTRVDEWPSAPRGGANEVSQLADRIRAVLSSRA